jgi:hypothetical protein
VYLKMESHNGSLEERFILTSWGSELASQEVWTLTEITILVSQRQKCRLSLGRAIAQAFFFFFFFCNLCGGSLGHAATPGLLCQPRVIVKMIMEKQMECKLAGDTEVLGEHLPQRHLVHHKSHTTRPGFEPGPPR